MNNSDDPKSSLTEAILEQQIRMILSPHRSRPSLNDKFGCFEALKIEAVLNGKFG